MCTSSVGKDARCTAWTFRSPKFRGREASHKLIHFISWRCGAGNGLPRAWRSRPSVGSEWRNAGAAGCHAHHRHVRRATTPPTTILANVAIHLNPIHLPPPTAATVSRQLLATSRLSRPVASPQSAVLQPLTCARRCRPTAHAPAIHTSKGRFSSSRRSRKHGGDSSSRADTASRPYPAPFLTLEI
jgi:hypothetical protein